MDINNQPDFFDDIDFDSLDSDIDFDQSAACAEPFIEYDNRRYSCSFTGHRQLSQQERFMLMPKLKSVILYLINCGVKEFHAGGAEGFDTLAAGVVHEISKERDDIRLILELPYKRSGFEKGNSRDNHIRSFIMDVADEINYHGEKPKNYEEAVKMLYKRNRVLIDKSHYCVCFLKTKSGGTAYTVNYASLHDTSIINLAEN